MKIVRLWSVLFCAAILSICYAPAVQAQPIVVGPFEISDYFKLHRISEIALSSDGEWLAYKTQSLSLDQNKAVSQIYVMPVTPGAKPILEEVLSAGHAIAWIPHSHELAFLSAGGGVDQVFSYEVSTHKLGQRTISKDSVVEFRFAPDGKKFAYVTRGAARLSSLYDEFRKEGPGILLDTDTANLYDFENPTWGNYSEAPTSLWLKAGSGAPQALGVPGDVKEFFWSSDEDSLSVTFVASDSAAELSRQWSRTSVGVIDVATGRFRLLAKAYPQTGDKPGRQYRGGEWLPGEKKVLIRRVVETDVWVSPSFPDWSVVDTSAELSEKQLTWHPIEADTTAKFFPTTASTVLMEGTLRAVRSLFELTTLGVTRSDVPSGLDGSSSLFAFSDDRKKFVFVNESLARPPEIYVRSGTERVRILTDLNGAIAPKLRQQYREFSWTSTDGARVSGWLVEPAERTHPGPSPLLTMIHGGPAYAYPNAFVPYFAIWPYPLDAYVSHGITVFIPNYRGTHTFGRDFQSPKKIDGEPVEDVVSGVQALIHDGIADPDRLGICGQSHGGWLGPVVLTRWKAFRASSFAEGSSSAVTQYELMPGQLNREVHDRVNGASLYDSPERYLELSPDLHFAGVSTANMFEAGAYSLAVVMLGLGKVSRRFGLPTEFVVYPQTDHNIATPRLQKESAERNLDWFRFWLKNEEDTDPAKVEQYARWRRFRKPQQANEKQTEK